jgi:hypothetical protein
VSQRQEKKKGQHSLVNPGERANEGTCIITPVTQAALDFLLHSSIITPPVAVSPNAIEAPIEESYTHVSTPPSAFELIHDYFELKIVANNVVNRGCRVHSCLMSSFQLRV